MEGRPLDHAGENACESPDAQDAQPAHEAALNRTAVEIYTVQARAVQKRATETLAAQIAAGVFEFDDKTRALLIDAHLLNALGVARRLSKFDPHLMGDLLQAGNVALVRAANSYLRTGTDRDIGHDTSNYHDFSGFAHSRIVSAVGEEFKRHRTLTYSLSDEVQFMNVCREELVQALRREPTIDELATAMFTTPKEVARILLHGRKAQSLDEPNDNGQTRGDTLVSHADRIEDIVTARITEDELIAHLASKFSPRDLHVFLRRTGLQNYTEEDTMVIARSLSLSRSFVNRILLEVRREASVFLGYEYIIQTATVERTTDTPLALLIGDITHIKPELTAQIQDATSADPVQLARLIEATLQTIPHALAQYVRTRYRLHETSEGPRLTHKEIAELLTVEFSTVVLGARRGTLRLVNNLPAVIRNDFDMVKIPVASMPAASPVAFLWLCGEVPYWNVDPHERLDHALTLLDSFGDERQKKILRALYGLGVPAQSSTHIAPEFGKSPASIQNYAKDFFRAVRTIKK